MTEEEQLEQKIITFVSQQTGDFHLQDMLDALGPLPGKRKGSNKEIIAIPEFQGLTFAKGLETGKLPEVFTPRHIYFQDACFIVSPRPEEIAAGILIPGHRCIPFFNIGGLNPWECTLLTGEGTEVSCTVIEKEMRSLTIYYNLFGVEHIGNFLLMDQKSNAEVLRFNNLSEETCVTLTAFDLADLYRKRHFTAGDALLFQVKDWFKGIFTIAYISRQELQELSAEWVPQLEKGFQQVFDIFGIKAHIEEQIAYAYYYAGKEALQKPGMHLGGFIDFSNQVYLTPFGIETKLWFDKEFTVSQVFAEAETAPKKRGFSGLLETLNAPCSEIEIEAVMRDELFRHNGKIMPDQEIFDAVLARIFGDDWDSFTDEQTQELFKQIQKRWKKIAKTYNYFTDQVPGKVRNTLLEILEDYYEWFRELSKMAVSPEEIPVQIMTSIGQMYSTLTDYLMLLNQYDIADQAQISQLQEILPAISSTLESLKENIIEDIKESRNQVRNSKLRLVRPSDKLLEELPVQQEPKHIFVFRISLKDIRPQIWRSVQIPGSFTLGDFHQVIQTLMGWHNVHLHEFKISHTYFGPNDFDASDFGMEIEDEEAYILDSLGLLEKQRFLYTYDFGDNWEHQILVSKVFPAEGFSEEEKYKPRCLKGKRACPPEDCGGPWGYEEIIEALASPNKKKSRELLEWVGDFEPESFDPDAVNKLFSS